MARMVNLLLDTHVLLWVPADDPALGADARVAIIDPANPASVPCPPGRS